MELKLFILLNFLKLLIPVTCIVFEYVFDNVYETVS